MRINKILFTIILVILIVATYNFYICYASLTTSTTVIDDGGGGGKEEEPKDVEGDEKLGLPKLDKGYKPSVESGGTAIDVISGLLGILTVVGVISVVLAIALIGFNTILGSASEKAEYQQKLTGVVIAGMFMIGGSAIAKLIISIAESIR